jgi:hypothetical protein
MTKVYRLEHPVYGTPYHGNGNQYKMPKATRELRNRMLDAHACKRRPGVYREFSDQMDDSFYCGCTSLDRLKTWFNLGGLWNELLAAGWEVLVYELDEKYVHDGRLQCIFKMRKARLIGKHIKVNGRMKFFPE